MSKTSLCVIIAFLVAMLGGYGYLFTKALMDIEKSAVDTLDEYCSPELVQRHKEQRAKSRLYPF